MVLNVYKFQSKIFGAEYVFISLLIDYKRNGFEEACLAFDKIYHIF